MSKQNHLWLNKILHFFCILDKVLDILSVLRGMDVSKSNNLKFKSKEKYIAKLKCLKG